MLRVEENYAIGIPQTAIVGFAPRGLAWHWTAGGTGRAGAESTIRHFQNTRYTVNASYHILLFREGSTTVAMWIVPVSRASHSMNPGAAFKPKSNSDREQARFAEVHRILARDSDPNADCISISFCGMPADLAAARNDPTFTADVRELARQLIAHPAVIDRPHLGHGWIQPTTRYETDATTGGEDLLIASVLYAADRPEEDDVYQWVINVDPLPGGPQWITFRPGCSYRMKPDLTAESRPKVYDYPIRRLVIGTVQGVDFGKGPTWMVLQGFGGPLLVAHEQDVTLREPLAPAADCSKQDNALRAIATAAEGAGQAIAAVQKLATP